MRKHLPGILSATFPRIRIEGTKAILEPGEGHVSEVSLPPLEDQERMLTFLRELHRRLPKLAFLLDVALLKRAYQSGRLSEDERKAIEATRRPLN